MQTFGDLIERFGGGAKMAPLIGVSANRIRQWSCRNSIPGKFWQTIIDAAKEHDMRGVNAAKLAELANASQAEVVAILATRAQAAVADAKRAPRRRAA